MLSRLQDNHDPDGRLMKSSEAIDAIIDRLRAGVWEAVTSQGPIDAREWAFLTHTTARDRDTWSVRGEEWRGPKYDGDVLISRDLVLSEYPSTAIGTMGAVRDLFAKQDEAHRLVAEIARSMWDAVWAHREAQRLPWPGYFKFAHAYHAQAEAGLPDGKGSEAAIARALIDMAPGLCLGTPELKLASMSRELRNVRRDATRPGGERGGFHAETLRVD